MNGLRVDDAIHALGLEAGRPLLVCDADEVLFAFMEGLLDFIGERGLSFDFASHALSGNIRRQADGHVLTAEEVRAELADFFTARTESLAIVPGAAEALDRLARDGVAIVILSNVPEGQREARQRALRNGGMPWPLVANSGDKGPAVATMAGIAAAPVAFVDDIGRQHRSVAEAAPEVHRFHFTAHPRLRALQPSVDAAHAIAPDWATLERLIRAALLHE